MVRNSLKLAKPIFIIMLSFILAFLAPWLINFIYCDFFNSSSECITLGSLLSVFFFWPLGAILFLIGIVMIFLRMRKGRK